MYGEGFLKLSDDASRGDASGSLNTLFSGLAFAGVIVAIILQGRELKSQRLELSLTRKEFTMQNNTGRRVRFENTFFNMLTAHR